MTKYFSYLPYKGVNSFAYFGCSKEDEAIASELVDALVSEGFRLYCDSCGSKYKNSAEEIASALNSADSAIVLLSEKSVENLAFRNAINYLLSMRKKLVCIKLGDFKLSHGLDMQLANIKTIPYASIEETVNEVLKTDVLTQEMIGEGMEKRVINRKRNFVMAGMIAAAVLIFAVSAFTIIDKRTSPEYLLKDVDGYEYLSISKYGDEGIAALAGKSIGELDLSGGKYSNLAAIKDIKVKTINVSDIGELALRPLRQVEGLETVKISQDQVEYAGDLFDAGLLIEIVH